MPAWKLRVTTGSMPATADAGGRSPMRRGARRGRTADTAWVRCRFGAGVRCEETDSCARLDLCVDGSLHEYAGIVLRDNCYVIYVSFLQFDTARVGK